MGLRRVGRFYVYEHRRKTDGITFYVGKGCRKRDIQKTGRNTYWHRVVKAHDYTVHRIYEGITEAEAAQKEIDLIEAYGLENLCNVTAGGGGMTGYKHSQESKDKISESNRNRIYSPETLAKMSKNSSARRPDVRAKISANHHDVSGPNHHLYDAMIRIFRHPDHGVFIGTQYELRVAYELSRSHLSNVVSGKRKRHKGWEIVT